MVPKPGGFPGASRAEKKKAFAGFEGYMNYALKHCDSSNYRKDIQKKKKFQHENSKKEGNIDFCMRK
jgi:hypothetical protein